MDIPPVDAVAAVRDELLEAAARGGEDPGVVFAVGPRTPSTARTNGTSGTTSPRPSSALSRHRTLLRDLLESDPEPEPEQPEPLPALPEAVVADETPPEPYPTGKFLDRLRDTHAAARAQVEQGLSLREIARRLGLGRNTVRKYARAASPEAMLHGQWQNRTSKLDAFRPYLEQRIAEGCTNRVRAQGWRRPPGPRGAKAPSGRRSTTSVL